MLTGARQSFESFLYIPRVLLRSTPRALPLASFTPLTLVPMSAPSPANVVVLDSTPVQREFLSFPDGDVVLVSNDDVEFRVDSLILRRASPLFTDMLMPPQWQTPNTPSKPVILDETGIILDSLLRLIYPPVTLPTISSPKHARALLRALKKYQITSNSFTTRLTGYIGTLEPPLRAWALAVELGNDEARKIAVGRFLGQSSDPLDDDVEQLTRVEGRSVQRLLRIRRDVVAHISKEINRFFPGLSTCSDHRKSMGECLSQAIQPHIPTDEALKATGFLCSPCAEHANSEENRGLRKELRSYIQEILEDAVRAENESTPALKVTFPIAPTRLLKAEGRRFHGLRFDDDWYDLFTTSRVENECLIVTSAR